MKINKAKCFAPLSSSPSPSPPSHLPSSSSQSTSNSPSPFRPASCDPAILTFRILGYNLVDQTTHEPFEKVDLFLPDLMQITNAAHVLVPAAAKMDCVVRHLDFRAGVHAASHATLACLPMLTGSDPTDFGCLCDAVVDARNEVTLPRIIIYEKPGCTGGCGGGCASGMTRNQNKSGKTDPLGTSLVSPFSSCRKIARRFGWILEAALERVRKCGCQRDTGCTACVQIHDCKTYNDKLSRTAAEIVLVHALMSLQG